MSTFIVLRAEAKQESDQHKNQEGDEDDGRVLAIIDFHGGSNLPFMNTRGRIQMRMCLESGLCRLFF